MFNGNLVRTGNGIADLAVDPNSGTIYAVWEDGSFSSDGHADVAFSKSTDGGQKWAPPIKVNMSPSGVQAFTPSVAVSADALQLYAGLEILTGAASAAERARLEHRLLGFLPIDARCSAGEFAQLAHAEIDGLIAQGAIPIVVGGTGLYLRAALAELDLLPPPRAGVRARLTARLASDGAEALHARLNATAPWAAASVQLLIGPRRSTGVAGAPGVGTNGPPPPPPKLRPSTYSTGTCLKMLA